MTSRDKIGVAVIIGLLGVFVLALYITIKRPTSSSGSFENNVIIEQRVKNLNK